MTNHRPAALLERGARIMKDVRCLMGMHRYRKRQVEDSQYLACARCGKERDTIPSGPTGRGMGGLT